MAIDGQERYQARLQVATGTLRDDLDQISRCDVLSVTETVDDVQREVRVLQIQVEQAEDDVRQHDRRTDELSRTVKQLKTNVQWIERHIRSCDAVTAVDLDTAGPDLRAAAQLAEVGAAAEAELLTTGARALRAGHIGQYTDAITRTGKAADQVLARIAELTQVSWDDDTHDRIRARYRAAKEDWIAAGAQVTGFGPRARQARLELAADDACRTDKTQIIADGQQGRSTLFTRLRTRITDAVLDGALMPIWLHDRLGAMPPAGQTAQWVDIATQILAYRITYHDQDPLVTISEVPPDASARRSSWANDIDRAVSDLHG